MSEKMEETFNELLGGLTGFAKPVAKKILNSDFAEEVKKILNNCSIENASDALKKLVDIAVQKAANGIRFKIAMILTVIAGIFAVLTTIATLAASGNIAIPIAVSVVLIAMIWLITGIVSKLISRRISGIIFKVVASKIKNFQKNKEE
ncbi:MAG: hypothetical protein LBH25_08075 [Fibromonadaceae bacterium]|nr:hypothetical protein [Fibromonadaceae bacterium]